ncbi:MAG: hypothetical protein EOO20_09575 [Chryseobacterium sp.]|nr:MAG: hypothetical protein EOO20_09575 [Chryseobacterium sp.]
MDSENVLALSDEIMGMNLSEAEAERHFIRLADLTRFYEGLKEDFIVLDVTISDFVLINSGGLIRAVRFVGAEAIEPDINFAIRFLETKRDFFQADSFEFWVVLVSCSSGTNERSLVSAGKYKEFRSFYDRVFFLNFFDSLVHCIDL